MLSTQNSMGLSNKSFRVVSTALGMACRTMRVQACISGLDESSSRVVCSCQNRLAPFLPLFTRNFVYPTSLAITANSTIGTNTASMAQDYMAALIAFSNDASWTEARLRLFETMGQQAMSEVARRCLQDEVSAGILTQVTSLLLDDRAARLSGTPALAQTQCQS